MYRQEFSCSAMHAMGSKFASYSLYQPHNSHYQNNMFGSMEESMIARVEASLAAVTDIKGHHQQSHMQPFKTDVYSHDISYVNNHKPPFAFNGDSVMEQMHGHSAGLISSHQFGNSLTQLTNMSASDQHGYSMYTHGSMLAPMAGHPSMHNLQEVDCNPRDLENFAEKFKQRRIKLGVTQADVGKALGNLKIAGVGSLSQSTICRFESLTLSHNNMIALKPILSAWLDEAEQAAGDKHTNSDMSAHALDKKRKRTSIAAPEKRSLEAYFNIQPRPSGEKIAQIADKLDLKKNVVRVWFCNQRQKQKRMKFAAGNQPH